LMSGDTTRHEQPTARNKHMKETDEDDAPTYVLEETNQSLTKEEYDALVSGEEAAEKEDRSLDASKEQTEEAVRQKDTIAKVGAATRKRKAAKIIGDDQDEGDEVAGKDAKSPGAKVIKKPKKKSKAVKLTFGDEEEG
jgi:delta 1-pyrroline-5-carboxylate dehydrogenase